MSDSRKTFPLLRSYYEAAKKIPDKAAGFDYFMAICAYYFDDEIPQIDGWASMAFELVRPNIDANRRRGSKAAEPAENIESPDSDCEVTGKSLTSNSAVTPKSLASDCEVTGKSLYPSIGTRDKGLGTRDKGVGIKDKGKGSEEGGRGGKPRKTPASQPDAVQWAENVTMTNAEHDKLLATYGSVDTARLIEILDNYKGANGKKYRSDYRAILSWCTNRLEEEKAKAKKADKGKTAHQSWTEIAEEMEAETEAKR